MLTCFLSARFSSSSLDVAVCTAGLKVQIARRRQKLILPVSREISAAFWAQEVQADDLCSVCRSYSLVPQRK